VFFHHALGKITITVTSRYHFFCREFLFAECLLTHGKLEKLYRVFFRRALDKITVTVPSRYHFFAESFSLPSVY